MTRRKTIEIYERWKGEGKNYSPTISKLLVLPISNYCPWTGATDVKQSQVCMAPLVTIGTPSGSLEALERHVGWD